MISISIAGSIWNNWCIRRQEEQRASEVKVIKVEKGTERSGITLALSSMKGIVWNCLWKVAKGPLGPRREGHPGWRRTYVRDKGTGRLLGQTWNMALFQMYLIEGSILKCLTLDCQIWVPNHDIQLSLQLQQQSGFWCGKGQLFMVVLLRPIMSPQVYRRVEDVLTRNLFKMSF